MRGKHLYKKILASLLILSLSFSNLSVAAQTTEAPAAEQTESVDETEPAALTEEEPTTESEEQTSSEDVTSSEEEQAPPTDNTGDQQGEEPGEPDQTPKEDEQPDDSNNEVTDPKQPATPPTEGEDPGTNPEQPTTPPTEDVDPGTNPEQPVTPPTESENPGTNPEQPAIPPTEGENPGVNPEQPVTSPTEGENPGTHPEQPTTPPTGEENPADKNQTTTPPTEDGATNDEQQPETTPVDQLKETDPEEELDFNDVMTEEELEALPEDAVGMTMFRISRTTENPAENPWAFSIKYVNQDAYPVFREKFNLKYQMTFSATGANIEKEQVKIRIPQSLLKTRTGNPIIPEQIAVPEENEGGTNNTVFRYRIVTDEANDEPMLEFYNCKEIPRGTNVVWQVLYKNVDVMEIEDLSEWSLQPAITVNIKKDTEEETEEAEYEEQTQDVNPLKGCVDTYVSIHSAAKNAYYEPYKKYAPGLYTEDQIKMYMDQELPEKYNGDALQDYRFVVWEIAVKGNATEPWHLELDETPFFTNEQGEQIPGEIVGFQNHLDEKNGYKLPILGPNERKYDGTGIWTLTSEQKSYDNWGSRFYVVTAYPAEGIISKTTKLENQAVVTMKPSDEKGEENNRGIKSDWTYEDYAWTYDGDILSIEKKYTEDETKNVYAGWLDAYQAAKDQGEDYGEFPFTTKSSLRGYKWTHTTNSAEGEVGVRKEGQSFKLVTVDDFMYAYPELGAGAPTGLLLDGDDYYFAEVDVHLWDKDYDPYEDRYVIPEETGKLVISMCYKDETAWTKVAELSMSEADKGHLNKIYTLDNEELQREPWRVKAEYQGTNHTIECQIGVKVRIRHDSPVMEQILDMEKTDLENPSNSTVLQSVLLKDLSGAWGEFYEGETLHQLAAYQKKTTTDPSDSDSEVKVDGKLWDYDAFADEKLEERTREVYEAILGEALPYRDDDSKKLQKLTPHADSFKKSVSINDSANGRVLVDYRLTAYDGYDVYNQEMVDYLKSTGYIASPGQNHVVFYDLLPYAMKYDPSVPARAGRIKELDNRGNYQNNPNLWDKAQVRVVVDSERDVIENYNGTGRTRVAFHIYYDGGDPAVYTNQRWIEGWGISFRAYYDRKDLEIAQSGKNISAFMPGDPSRELIGKKGEEVFPDNGENYPSNGAADYRAFGANINGDGSDTSPDREEPLYNVLYANHAAEEDIAVDAETGIKKLVRADADRFGNFGKTASVAPGGSYTYEIAVGNAGNSGGETNAIKNIVVYDLLEAEDESQWNGTFESVVLSGLNEAGIAPVVYYSTASDVAKPGSVDELIQDGQWTTDKPESGVTAIAVDMRKTKEGGEFELKDLQSVSFQVRMKAPEGSEHLNQTTVNRASYYAEYVNGGLLQAKDSNTTSVTIKKDVTLEVIKRLAEDVPESVRDGEFEFELFRKGDEENLRLANQEYTLWEENAEGEWNQKDTERVHATDGSGRFTLQADEKAVFSLTDQISADGTSLSEIIVEEVQSVFWNPETEDHTTADDSTPTRTITITNHYRPILYVQKLLQGVLDGNDEAQQFTFKVETKSEDGDWEAFTGKEFYYVDRAGLMGGIPGPGKENSWKKSTGTTDEAGEFSIQQGDLVAVCFDTVGTEYRVSEIAQKGTSTTAEVVAQKGTVVETNWICQTEPQSDSITIEGSLVSITNSYRWKELYLTKKITHQDQEDYKDVTFTFQIQRVTEQDSEKVLQDLSTEEMARIQWQLLDDKTQEPVGDKTSLATGGKLTFAAGRTVCIRGLEAGATYQVTEEPDPKGDYLPSVLNKDGVTVTMPEYGTRKDIIYTNDYQRRPLSITKTVVYDPKNEEEAAKVKEASFYMVAKVTEGVSGEAKLLANTPYTLMEQGKVVEPEAGKPWVTDENGGFYLKNGQTAVFKDAGKAKWLYQVTESREDNQNQGFSQLYPENNEPVTGAFTEEGAEASFINGSSSGLYIRKEYVYPEGDTAAENYLGIDRADEMEKYDPSDMEKIQTFSMEKSLNMSNTTINRPILGEIKPQSSVDVTLTLNGQLFNEFCEIVLIENATGRLYKDVWPGNAEDSLDGIYQLPPGYTVVIPSSVLENYKDENGNISYELKEQPYDQHQIKDYFVLGNGDEPGGSYILEINQKTPADDGSVKGTVKDNPVATVINEVKSRPLANMVDKAMTDDSYEVPKDAKLVWKVEQYVGGKWIPAEGVSYVTLDTSKLIDIEDANQVPTDPSDNSFIKDYPKTESPYTCDQILTTGPDGKIVLRKPEKGMPAVQFVDEDVRLNLNGSAEDGDLRVVEVPEESDTAWGMLAGYRYGGNQNIIQVLGSLELPRMHRMVVQHNVYGLETFYSLSVGEDLPEDDIRNPKYIHASGFCNSNHLMPIEISKEMSTGATGPFTMVLEQVLLLEKDDGKTYAKTLEGVDADGILMSKGYADIPYTVYNIGSTTQIRDGKTKDGGEIQLYAGEYAIVNLPEETLWTVYEKDSANYQLADLEFESDPKRMKKLDEHTLLFYQTPRRYPTSLRIQTLEKTVGLEDILDPNEDYNNASPRFFNPLERHIKVFGKYSDGTERELAPNEVIYSWEGLWATEKFDSTKDGYLTYNIRWSGKLVSTQQVFDYKAQPEICLTRELIEKGVYDYYGDPINLTSDTVVVPEYIRTELDGELHRVTRIGEEGKAVFGPGVTNVNIPSSVTEISSEAFKDCDKLQGIRLMMMEDSIKNKPWGAPETTKISWRLSSGGPMI